MLVHTFLLVLIFIEKLLMDVFSQWLPNDLYAGTFTGLIMAVIFSMSVFLIALHPQGFSWKKIGWQKFQASYWGWMLLGDLFLVIGAAVISYLMKIWFGMGEEK